ncbi:hypothetical protein NE237_016921 [Protea cynaroides]|uniref:Tetrapyrrole biosynthesis uroporphyrinogen III synthase domain-containing protein n=1 Tax=Protea cynaroides TaxID=273540 RepID=A0A9Q0K6P4_9MAGN|nr:hypothetical protein NE237_016921 [Protea cynaroides]
MSGTSILSVHKSPAKANGPTNLSPTPAPAPIYRRRVAFTTPQNYAERLTHLLQLNGAEPIWCPTVVVEPTPGTKASIRSFLLSSPNQGGNYASPLEDFSAIAFTSRTGISAFAESLAELENPPLSPVGEDFTVTGIGKDAELLTEGFLAMLCENPKSRTRVLVPPKATPASMVESLGIGHGRRILCPVPLVLGINEPPVIPDFLRDLAAKDWIPVRVSAYVTRWAGPKSAEVLLRQERLDAIVFTSTGEVEGMLKSCRTLGFNDWETVREKWPGLVVAAHGPVTALGAERLGVAVDVVSSRYDSFEGIVEALLL